MSHGLLLPEISDVGRTTLAVCAEELGYESVWLGELWGASSPVQLTEIAGQTETITLGTAILNVFSRTPATLAMTANGLARISDGRFILGVGTSTQKSIEDLHGMVFDRPVRRAHETIELTKRFLGHGKEDDDTTGSSDGRVGYVTDEMVTALGVAGTPDEARAQLRDLTKNSIIDHPIVTLSQQAADELAEPTIEALAPE